MTEDVKPEVIKRTQDLLGKYFKKPPLTEKLLKKPPFRFLHDIISSVIRETGFLDGLFTEEELISENIKDKEAKLAYLTKLIDVVKLITGNNLTTRASKIIAGHEPTKTNELLQAIGRALDKKVSSVEAIEHYRKSSDKKAGLTSKSKAITKEAPKKPAPRQSSQSRKSTEKETPLTEQKKRSSSTGKVSARETKTRSEDKREKQRKQEKENKERDAETKEEPEVVENPPAEPIEEKPPSSVRRQRRSSSSKPKEDVSSPKTSESPKIKPALLDSTNSPTHKVKENCKESPTHKTKSLSADKLKETSSQRAKETGSRIAADSQSEKITENDASNKNSTDTEALPKKSTDESAKTKNSVKLSPSHKPRKTERIPSAIVKQHTFENPGSPPPKPLSSVTDVETTVSVPEPIVARPRTSLRPPSARPISARPAAPRMRSKTEFIFNEDISTPVGNVNVIVENFDTKEEDDADDMVVVETGGGSDSLGIDSANRTESRLSEEHGHLVAQILETQRELINTENVDVMPKKVEIEWETGSRRDREATVKEIDKLRGAIQTLTRATNPLGKLLDYLQEDVEMMQRELHEWRNQYNQLSEQLQREQIQTQDSIEPMKKTLKDIEDNIKNQLDKICQVKANVLKNDQKIHRLLNGHS